MKKIINKSIALLLISVVFITRADAAGLGLVDMPPFLEYVIYGVSAIIIIVAFLMIFRMLNLIVRMKEIQIYEKHGLDEFLAKKELHEGSFWKYLNSILTDNVPIEKETDILLDHNYDGIRELDNNLPPWWVYGFYLTIAIAVVYMLYFHVFNYGPSSQEEYEIEMAEAEKAVEEYLATQANLVDETNVTLLTDEAALTRGQEIFQVNCIACHLEHGGGGPMSVGPNLTDEYWLHGGSIQDVFTTIKYGVPEKGMISWQSQLRPGEMADVASYILSLQGTNPPNAKEPQGELYVPVETTEVPADSTEVESGD